MPPTRICRLAHYCPCMPGSNILRRAKTRKKSIRMRQTSAASQDHAQQGGPPSLPAKLVQARQLKQQGLLASGVLLACGVLASIALDLPLPHLPQTLEDQLENVAAIASRSAAVLLAVAAAVGLKKQADDTLAVEWHNGRLYLQLDVPPRGGPTVAKDAIEVKAAGAKGNGAFARARIPKGSFIGNYEGEMLSEAEFWSRYPAGEGDYCMKVDSEWTIDAVERAKDTSSFSPVHMNHSSTRSNISRRCGRADRTISCYAAKDIEAGEELLLDYGALYWRGREHLVVD